MTPARRNAILLAAGLVCLSGMIQLAVALGTVTIVAVTGVKSILGLGPAVFLLAGAAAVGPAGHLSDRVGRMPVIRGGFVLGIVDNGQNASTGGQPTPTAAGLDLAEVARATGCRHVVTCTEPRDIELALREAGPDAEALILHLRVISGDGRRRVVDLDPVRLRKRASAYLAR